GRRAEGPEARDGHGGRQHPAVARRGGGRGREGR
ncbi:MAG: hypothetical protein AVDCRST_MAG01-01-3582, partial [uncultured Rubrobacteraceae bacterium]